MKKKRKYGTGSIRKGKGCRFWTLTYNVDGKVRSESSRTESYEEAEAILVARLRQLGKMSANAATLATDGLLSTIGCAAELLVAADLLNRGIEVFRALSQHSSCDMIAHRHGRMVRVEVKTGRIGRYGPEVALSRQRGRFDVLAVVDRKSGIHYYPRIEEIFSAGTQGNDARKQEGLPDIAIEQHCKDTVQGNERSDFLVCRMPEISPASRALSHRVRDIEGSPAEKDARAHARAAEAGAGS